MKTLLVLDGLYPQDQHPENALVVLWNDVASGNCEDNGISLAHTVAERLLPLREELNAWTVDMGQTPILGRSVESWLAGGEALSMWWCATLTEKHPKITMRLFDALKARVLEALAREHEITNLALVSADPALIETLQLFCEQAGYGFQLLAPHAGVTETSHAPALFSKERLRRCYYALPARAKALVRFPAWLWQCRRHLPHVAVSRSQEENQATFVSYFPNIDLASAIDGRFRSRYWEGLHDVVTQNGRAAINWVFLFFPSSQCDLKQALLLRDTFAAKGVDGLTFHFLEEFLDCAAIRRAWKRYSLLRYAAKKIEPDAKKLFAFRNSSLNFWPLLKENWYDSFEGWRCLERCLYNEAFKGYAAWCGKQECTIYVQENCPWERMLCQNMHDAGNTAVYGMQHSTVRPTDFRYFDDPRQFTMPSMQGALPEQWLNNGTAAREALLDAGMPQSRSRLVEALRYQYLASDVKPNTSEIVAEGANSVASAAEGTKSLLICTSFFADETDAHLRTLAAAHQAGALEGWDLRIKAHPYLPVEERLAELFPQGSAPIVVSQPIGELLTPGVTVWASNSTTVALEAVYRSLSVLVEAPHNDLNLSPVQDLPGIPFVRTAEDVLAALATVQPVSLPPEYLCLDATLPLWKVLLAEHGLLSISDSSPSPVTTTAATATTAIPTSETSTTETLPRTA